MKKHITYITLILGILLGSCRKDALFDGVNCTGNCFILEGKLVDSAANYGLSKGEIKFYFREVTATFFTKTYYLGRSVTDNNGDYIFKFNGTSFANSKGYYYAEAFKGNLFHDPLNGNQVATFDLDSSAYNTPFIQNFLLFRPATLKLRVIASTVTNFQFLTVSYAYGAPGSGIVINGGRKMDTTLTFKTAGDIRTFIQSDAKGNGVNITKRDTLIVPANSTGHLEIRF